MMVAAYRARATVHGSALCRDPWAAALAGEEGEALARAFDALQPEMELWIALRTAWLDRAIADRIHAGARRVVLLGAGLDTRAARLAHDGVRFFEVDHPLTQAEKRSRVAELDGYPIDAAFYVPCDFERDDFLDRLAAAGFDPQQPAALVWEGVTPYLTEAAVRGTLRRIATGCHPHTAVFFDTVGRKMAEGATRHDGDLQTLSMVGTLGEPLRWGTNDPLPLLYEEGFRKVRVESFDEVALDFTGTYDRERRWRFQSLVTASVGAPR